MLGRLVFLAGCLAAAGWWGGSAAAGQSALAEKAPHRTLEEGGVLFNPEIAGAMQQVSKAGTAYTFAVLGPGLAAKDFDSKALGKWMRAPAAKELVGPPATPRFLLANLPPFLTGQKPEVLFLAGDSAATKKINRFDALDWEDLARLCLRLGVVPVLLAPTGTAPKGAAGDAPEDQREIMVAAAAAVNCPVIDTKNTAQLPRLMQQTLTLLDQHVFGRAPLNSAGNGGPAGKKGSEEE